MKTPGVDKNRKRTKVVDKAMNSEKKRLRGKAAKDKSRATQLGGTVVR
jgi:hypothetical protein